MPDNLPKKLSDFSGKGYVIAPAGFGKTHLIAAAVKAASNCQLVLTHTFAGVNSIKFKMNQLGVPSNLYRVETIASWSLQLCLAYPKTSAWKTEYPSAAQWVKLYSACGRLLEKKFIKHIITCSYSGVYVDEYQDCSESQHQLISALAEFLPCRILGDPLQSIFEFDGGSLDWNKHIYPQFKCLGKLEIPWRWINSGSGELGDWLNRVRILLENGKKINLLSTLPVSVKRETVNLNNVDLKQYTVLCGFLSSEDSVIAMHAGSSQFKNKTHKLAQKMRGRFSSIEEIEGKELLSFVKKIDSKNTASEKFLLALDFAKKCFNSVSTILSAGTKRGEIARLSKSTKYPALLETANRYLIDPSSKNLFGFFCLLKNNPETATYRRDLLNRFMNVLRIHIEGEVQLMLDAANLYQLELRRSGRPIRHNKLIATTLLVKGLEYDHAVILDAGSLSQNDLYVAMTRGAKTLTIITTDNSLPSI